MVEHQEVRGSRRVRLTDAGIRSLPAGNGKPIDYSDTVQRGLRLRVSPSGERTFLLAYTRPRDGAGVKLSIGSLSEGMTLAQARREAAALLALLRREPPVDPSEERAKRREAAKAESDAVQFSHALEVFVKEELPRYRPATAAGWLRYIEVELKPALGHLKPEEITADDLAELRAKIARGVPGPKKDGKPTWERKPAPVSAHRAFEVVRRILGWLTTTDADVAHVRRRAGITRLEANPALAATTFRRKRNGTRAEGMAKAYTDAQIKAIFSAAEAEPAFAPVLTLLAHTGGRHHDARAAKWDDVDTDRKVWTVPTHKTSGHTGAPHVVPLSEGALDVLRPLREANLAAGFGGKGWVFRAPTGPCEVCGKAGAGHVGKDQKSADRIKKAAGIKDRGLLHRFRDTLKTRLSEHGVDGRVSEALLCHVPPGITGVYDHSELLPQRREALEWWSNELARILGEPAPERKEGRA